MARIMLNRRDAKKYNKEFTIAEPEPIIIGGNPTLLKSNLRHSINLCVYTLEAELQVYAAAKEWKKVLKISEFLPLEEKSKYLWTWPTEEGLYNFKATLHELGVQKILSIGCGTGLLEWIIQESTGISVYGLEVDRSWWESSYSPSSFIKLNFMENECMESEFLQRCCETSDWNFCLFFCYFNNGRAFREYLRLYRGTILVIIGPVSGIGIHTDPEPLSPDFPDSKWTLFRHFNISKDNIIAIYKSI